MVNHQISDVISKETDEIWNCLCITRKSRESSSLWHLRTRFRQKWNLLRINNTTNIAPPEAKVAACCLQFTSLSYTVSGTWEVTQKVKENVNQNEKSCRLSGKKQTPLCCWCCLKKKGLRLVLHFWQNSDTGRDYLATTPLQQWCCMYITSPLDAATHSGECK